MSKRPGDFDPRYPCWKKYSEHFQEKESELTETSNDENEEESVSDLVKEYLHYFSVNNMEDET